MPTVSLACRSNRHSRRPLRRFAACTPITLSAPADLAPAIPIAPWLTTELTTEPMRTESPMRALTHPGGTRASVPRSLELNS